MESEKGNNVYKDRIINKHQKENIEIEIGYSIYDFYDTEAESLIEEINLISEIGRHDKNQGSLANKTDGGDGTTGHLAHKRGDSASAKPVYAEYILYPCVEDASEFHKVTGGAIKQRIKNGWDGYYFYGEQQNNPTKKLLGRYKKKVHILGKEYNSLSESSENTGIDSRQISKRIQNGWKGYYYIDEGQRTRKTVWGSRTDNVECEIRGVYYRTIRDAEKEIQESESKIRTRLLSSNFPEYKRLDGKIIYKKSKPKFAKKIKVDNKIFNSRGECAKEYGITTGTVDHRCDNTNYKNWSWVDSERQKQREKESVFSSKPIECFVDGNKFESLSEVSREYDVDISTAKKRFQSKVSDWKNWICDKYPKKENKDGKPSRIPIIVYGVEYSSVSECYKHTGIQRPKIKKMLDDKNNKDFIYKE